MNNISSSQLKNKYKDDLLITQALIQQGKIGYNLVSHGKIAKLWINIQKRYLIFHPSPMSTDIWAIKLIHSLMKCSIQIWKSRNDFNNMPKEICNSSQIHRNNLNIHQIYKKFKNKTFGLDCYLFSKPPENLIQLPVSYKKKWIAAVHIAEDMYRKFLQKILTIILKSQNIIKS